MDRARDVEISVHCDVEVFSWLLAYAQQSNQNPTRASSLQPTASPLSLKTRSAGDINGSSRNSLGSAGAPAGSAAWAGAAFPPSIAPAAGLQLPVEKVLPVLISSHFLQVRLPGLGLFWCM